MRWVVSFLEVDAFLPIWILFVLDFYCYTLDSGYLNRKFEKKVSESLLTKQNRPTLNKPGTSVSLKLFN